MMVIIAWLDQAEKTTSVYFEVVHCYRLVRACTILFLKLSLEDKWKKYKKSILHNFLCILCIDCIYYETTQTSELYMPKTPILD
jgi:hypothetical protein